MCATNDGILLVSVYEKNTILRVGTNRKSVKTFTRMNHVVKALCTTEHGVVVSGCDDDKQVLSLVSKSSDFVKTASRPDYWRNIDRLAVHPISGNVCVCDHGDRDVRGSLVILTSTLNYIDMYDGRGELKHHFDPSSVCVDSCGHILVADLSNDCVHLLSSNARFLRYLLTETDGVQRPSAIAVDWSDQVWVGCDREKNGKEHEKEKVLVFKYLVEVDNFGVFVIQ